MPLLKPLLVWCLLLAAMYANGTFRQAVLVPALGARRARPLSILLGLALFIAILAITGPWLRPAGLPGAIAIGALWAGLTVAFELLFLHFGAGDTWEKLLGEHELPHGKFWPLAAGAAFVAPLVMQFL